MRGFWPVIAARSAIAPSSAFESLMASPSPTLRTIFSNLGICMALPSPSCVRSAGAISSR
jgi:hypothetical protein